MNKKKKNILSRIGAVILAIMCMLMPMSAFAEDATATTGTMPTINTKEKGSITVHKYNLTKAKEDKVYDESWTATGEANSEVETAMKKYGIAGVEFTYLKVADISTKNETTTGKVGVVYSNVPADLAEILGLSGTEFTSDEINDALSRKLAQSPSDTKTKLTEYVKKSGSILTTDENGYATTGKIDLGLYLMVETKFPNDISVAVNPFFVSVPMTKADGSGWFYDVTVYPKNETDKATVDKLVRQDVDKDTTYDKTANGSIGDQMDYIFVSHLPQISKDTTTYLSDYYFTDIASAGLTYNEDAAIYFYDDETDARANNTDNAYATWKHGSTNFTETYTPNDDGTTTMTVTPTEAGYKVINSEMSEKFMVVSYSAKINEKAILGDDGNENEVTLNWRRDPSAEMTTETSSTEVYTFGLNLTKEFAGKNGNFSEVQFILQNTTDGYYVVAKETAEKGVYTVTGKTDKEDEATKFVPSSTGKLVINGIEADVYKLTEIKTSEGYSLLKDPITIEITKDGKVHATAKVDGKVVDMSDDGKSTNARVDLTIVNRSNFTLPITGGTGTILFTLCGCVLALVGIAIITGKKKTR